jgi:hypothetical protein
MTDALETLWSPWVVGSGSGASWRTWKARGRLKTATICNLAGSMASGPYSTVTSKICGRAQRRNSEPMDQVVQYNLLAGFSIAEKKRPAKGGVGSSAEAPPQLDPCAYCQTVGSEPFVKCISYTAPVVAEPLTHGWISAHKPKMCTTKTLHLKRPTGDKSLTETRASTMVPCHRPGGVQHPWLLPRMF